MKGFAESIMSFLPMVVVMLVMYFFVMRPQKQKAAQHAQLLDNLKPGDRVVTSCGVVGIVSRIDEDADLGALVVIDIDNGVKISFIKQRIAQIVLPHSHKTIIKE